MKKIVFGLLCLVSISFCVSCTESKHPGYEQAENGIYYISHIKGNDTTTPKLTDYVTINMSYRLADTLLFDSKSIDSKLRFPLTEPNFKGDLYDMLMMMSPGDSMGFVTVADSFYFKTIKVSKLPDFVEAGEAFYYDIALLKLESTSDYQQSVLAEQQEKRNEEMKSLLAYLRDNNIEQPPLSTGLYFIEDKKGKGPKPDSGDIITFNIRVSELNGELLFDSFNSNPLTIEYGQEFDTRGFTEGIGLLRKGGSAKLIVPSSIGVGSIGMQGVDGFTTLVYDIELTEIMQLKTIIRQREEDARKKTALRGKVGGKELQLLLQYLSNNGISEKPTSSGLYFIPVVEGKGPLARHGNTVDVHYKLFDLKGNLIESSYEAGNALRFVLGTGAVIEGWEEGLKLMNRGCKASLIIPSTLAYGKEGNGEVIPPNSTLVFDIELVSIK